MATFYVYIVWFLLVCLWETDFTPKLEWVCFNILSERYYPPLFPYFGLEYPLINFQFDCIPHLARWIHSSFISLCPDFLQCRVLHSMRTSLGGNLLVSKAFVQEGTCWVISILFVAWSPRINHPKYIVLCNIVLPTISEPGFLWLPTGL